MVLSKLKFIIQNRKREVGSVFLVIEEVVYNLKCLIMTSSFFFFFNSFPAQLFIARLGL